MNKNTNKFHFDEIVEIINSRYENEEVLNDKGYVAGMVINDQGKWEYGVYLFKMEEVWRFEEEDLKSTEKFVSSDFNKTGESIKVIVDKDGKGKIK